MTVVRAGSKTALFLLCAAAACTTDTPLENRSPERPPSLGEHPALASVVTSTDTLESVADAFTRNFAPNINYGTVDSLTVRSFSASANRFSVYVRFDQAAIESRVGTGQLDSARLEFYLRDGGSWPAGGDWLNAYRVPNSWAPNGWTEGGITANCPHDTNTSNSALNCPGGVWDTTGFGAVTPTDQVLLTNDTRNWISFDVTTDVADWIADTANHGWYIAKQNNNNNERIVFWSRESAQNRPRLVLYVSQDTAFRLSPIVEPGVQTSLAPSDTLLAPSTVVTYSFTPTSGYQNVQATLDGQSVPASGTFTMLQDRVLMASADRIVSVSSADQALVQTARAVLLSSDPASAYQTYLNQVHALVASTSPEDAQARLDAVHFLTYDPIEDSAAIRHAEESLTNRMFTLGDTVQPDTLAEPTTFIFVNGINNLFTDAAATAALVDELRNEVPVFQRPAFEAKFFYNRTFSVEAAETPEMRDARCMEMRERRRKFLGTLALELFMVRCTAASIPDRDLAESRHQLINLIIGSSVTDIDARVLADSLQLHRERGRHVIAVPHSQGSLMMQQALVDLRGVYNYSEESDSTCVGVMSLAASVSGLWGPLPAYRRKGIVLRGDPVADHVLNTFPRIDNDSSRRLTAAIDSLSQIADQGVVGESYRENQMGELAYDIHSATTYLVPTESRTVIKSMLDSLYHSCVPATVLLNSQGKDHPVGQTFQVTADVKDREFETLNGRRITWSSSTPGVASIDSGGMVAALSVGSVTITGRSGTAKGQATLNIHEPSPYPPGVNVFGTWERTVPDGSGGSCLETLEIGLDARSEAVCDNGSDPVTTFGVSVNAPHISGRLAPLPPSTKRWLIELTGDGTTLKNTFVRFIGDPEPVEMPVFTRP